jgi:hypothetical protein
MTKNTNTKEKAPKEQTSPKLQLKQSFLKAHNFVMFLGTAIGSYVLYFDGNTLSLKIVAGVLVVDAARHAYKLIAVVK